MGLLKMGLNWNCSWVNCRSLSWFFFNLNSNFPPLNRKIKSIWHGSHADGVSHSGSLNCRSWWRAKPYLKSMGSSISNYMPAMNEEQYTCDTKLAVLCVQVEPEFR